MRIAVVILNWNGKHFLEQFLPNIIKFSVPQAEVIVADNGSTDDSVDFLKKTYPQLRLIELPLNGGFSKGYNDAFSQIEADYYVLLNSDIEVTENWITPVIELMENDEKIAVCQPKLLSYHNRTHFEYAGAAGGFIDQYGYPFCRGRLFQTLEEDHGQYNDVAEIFWATGACMFVRANLYHKYGGLDNAFFAHMEEIDFCWRMKNAGYKIMYYPQSTVYHIGGGSLPKSSARKTYLNFRNNFTLLYKNLPSSQLIKVFVIRILLDNVAAIKFLFEGGFKDFAAVSKAHFRFYRSLSTLSKNRKKTHPIKVSKVYKGNIVVDYFLKGKKKFSQLKNEKFS